MEQYTRLSYRIAETTTKAYSTSFSMSSRLFDASIRPHIYAIYGLVRIADEIVDTYMGTDAEKQLNELEAHTLEQMDAPHPFSANPLVHAFVTTAQQFSIEKELVTPFFESMRADLTAKTFTKKAYEDYIYGSAEVIGLFCLKICTQGDASTYKKLAAGAKALGSAYQKVNFLRDMRADFTERGRVYFPNVHIDTFTKEQKQAIEKDIEQDFLHAKEALPLLPHNARAAIQTSYDYYWQLFKLLKKAPVSEVTRRRLRVPTLKKLGLYAKAKVVRS